MTRAVTMALCSREQAAELCRVASDSRDERIAYKRALRPPKSGATWACRGAGLDSA
jgi:hypothetical protein